MVGILSSLLGSIVVVSGTLFFALLCVITHEFVVGYLKNKNNYKKNLARVTLDVYTIHSHKEQNVICLSVRYIVRGGAVW